MLAVARVEEGIALRQGGITAPILVTGGTLPQQLHASVAHGLTQAVYTPAQVQALQSAAQALQQRAQVHIKVDTGMRRTGVQDIAQCDALLQALQAAPFVQPSGIYTHFAVADVPQAAYTGRQYQRFLALCAYFTAHGLPLPRHCDNTAAMILGEHPLLEGGRLGIGIYGLAPSAETAIPALQPALQWVTHVVDIHTLQCGDSVSYGCTFTADRPMRIATLPVGYGDGYRRAFGNRAAVLLQGQRAPVVGRVCMDHIMVDITHLPTVEVGSEAVLLGCQGDACIPADELATLADTIHYEIVTGIAARVPRVYVP